MIKKCLQANFVLFAIILSITTQNSVQAKTITGSASAVIKEQIEISEIGTLNFGMIAPVGGTSGSITLSPAGTSTGTNATPTNALPRNAAHFSATGTPNASVILTFNNGHLNGPGTAMTIQNFTHNAGPSPAFNGSGTLDFNVGADLMINNNQGSGGYNGTYSMTINYQ